MPKWTYQLTIINHLDRALELVSSSIPWGRKQSAFPGTIEAGGNGVFSVYAPAGTMTGIEFYFTMSDKCPQGEPSYGSFSVSVDMPYWKHANTGKITCTDLITQKGFEDVPDGAHDYATTATISLTTYNNANLENDLLAEYCSLYDWKELESLPVVNPYDYSVDDAVPEKNILAQRKPVARTERTYIQPEMWNQIVDKKYPSAYSQKNFLSGYFTVSAYEIRKNKTIPIPANTTYEKEVEITNTSTVRRETSSDFQIENTITADGKGEAFNLSNTLCIRYEMHSLNEYCDENMKMVRETFNYNECDYDRNVVLWDLVKVVALYRVCKNGTIELVGIGDYYDCATQRTYATQDTLEDISGDYDDLACANSENIYYRSEEDMPPVQLISGEVMIGKQKYKWREQSFGESRGILFNPDKHEYKFMPNPHDDPKYNKRQQKWYNNMVEEIVDKVRTRGWTNRIEGLEVNDIPYTASVER